MISVCIATYNGELFIYDQIKSILLQLDNDDEIIISDDFSTDRTLDIISSFNDNRIKIFYNEKKRGYIKNFENSILKSNGNYIFLADQDDIWFYNKIKICKDLLMKFDLIVHDAILIDDIGNSICNSYFKMVNSRPGFFKNLYKNTYIGCCMAFRRRLIKYILPFPDSFIAHDIWTGFIAYHVGNVYFYNNQLIFYRRHPQALSYTGIVNKNNLYFKIKYRVLFLVFIIIKFLSISISNKFYNIKNP